jgi:hypothetical protein
MIAYSMLHPNLGKVSLFIKFVVDQHVILWILLKFISNESLIEFKTKHDNYLKLDLHLSF